MDTSADALRGSWHREHLRRSHGASLIFLSCSCTPPEGPAWVFQGSEHRSAPPAVDVSAGPRRPCCCPRQRIISALVPATLWTMTNVHELRIMRLRWGGEGNRISMPRLIPVEPPTQWNPCPVLVPHHIPVAVQKDQAGHKILCKVALSQAGCIGSWSGVSEISVFCRSPCRPLSSPELCLL